VRYKVRYHPDIGDDLRRIGGSLLPHAGQRSTLRIVTALRDAARRLSDTPHRGTLRAELFPGLRAIPAARRGVIAFTVDDERREVFVCMIAYGGFDWSAHVIARRPDVPR
jgi:plasmid stabilization system protein ParE